MGIPDDMDSNTKHWSCHWEKCLSSQSTVLSIRIAALRTGETSWKSSQATITTQNLRKSGRRLDDKSF